MGDYANFDFSATIKDPDVRKIVRGILEDYNGTFIYEDDVTDDSISFGANEVWLGSVDKLAGELGDLFENGYPDFDCPVCDGTGKHPGEETCLRCAGEGSYTLPVADFPYVVHDEPKYEWMGSIIIHIPGMEDFSGECDQDGTVRPAPSEIIALVDKATDLEELKKDVAMMTGHKHYKAFQNWGKTDV